MVKVFGSDYPNAKNIGKHSACKYNKDGELLKDDGHCEYKQKRKAEIKSKQHILDGKGFGGLVKGNHGDCPQNIHDFSTDYHNVFQFTDELAAQSTNFS